MRQIEGYRVVYFTFKETRVIAAEDAPVDFTADLIITETDTYRVLDKEKTFRYVEEHPIRVFTAAHNTTPAEPGSIIVNGSAPLRLQAVVYDFDRGTICHQNWLRQAWQNIFEKADREECRFLATPLLGQKEPALTFRQRAGLFHETLTSSGKRTRNVWLQMNGKERRNWHSFVVGSERSERM